MFCSGHPLRRSPWGRNDMALVHPHGKQGLKPLLLEGAALAAERKRAATLPALEVSSREKGDLIMLGIGGFTPLDGFMTHGDWEGVCDGYKMANGLFWPIPVTLSTDDETIKAGDDIALVDGETGDIMGTMKVTEKYSIDKAHECMQVYKTTDLEHPSPGDGSEQTSVGLGEAFRAPDEGGVAEEVSVLLLVRGSLAVPPRAVRSY